MFHRTLSSLGPLPKKPEEKEGKGGESKERKKRAGVSKEKQVKGRKETREQELGRKAKEMVCEERKVRVRGKEGFGGEECGAWSE